MTRSWKPGGAESFPFVPDQREELRREAFFERIGRWQNPDERLSHHEGREGHEDWITERASNLKKVFSTFVLFVCFVVKILLLVVVPSHQ